MTRQFDPRDWSNALSAQHRTPALGPPASVDPRQRADYKVRIIEARVKLKIMRDRTEALQQSLEEFRARRAALGA
ncbi:MAG: hypothetical protein IT467_02735 [Dokdonella sp.]|uniref:hypothetical protein n=1 Tax=Dokdonella sp. TaxID=2291710 RepID=UPI001ACF00D7|nr:hypothetical protein [Dokdonella sp.]MBZ0221798.1 hypothetical protein [Dokdonella sp.]MCC7254828.1 hypothetical protein [Dokdonella sp.]CAG0993441.1 hypothetical protein GPROT1_03215 [Gammaproteobacteria bacterium]